MAAMTARPPPAGLAVWRSRTTSRPSASAMAHSPPTGQHLEAVQHAFMPCSRSMPATAPPLYPRCLLTRPTESASPRLRRARLAHRLQRSAAASSKRPDHDGTRYTTVREKRRKQIPASVAISQQPGLSQACPSAFPAACCPGPVAPGRARQALHPVGSRLDFFFCQAPEFLPYPVRTPSDVSPLSSAPRPHAMQMCAS